MPESKDDPLKDVSITIDDFRNCGWKDAIQNVDKARCWKMGNAFSASVAKAIENEKFAEAKILQLLSDISHMDLRGLAFCTPSERLKNPNVISGLPLKNFSPSDFEFCVQVLEKIDEPILCARMADVLWLRLEPKNQKYALLAIDNYCKLPIDEDAWVQGIDVCWDRAIKLCLMLKKDAKNKLDKIEAKLLKFLINSSPDDRLLALRIADLFLKRKLGHKKSSNIAEKLEKLAIAFENSSKPYEANLYFIEAEKFYESANDLEKQAEMIAKIAEDFVAKGEFCQSLEPPDNISATPFYLDAIEKYKTMPNKLKEKYNVRERIEALRSVSGMMGKEKLNQMVRIYSPEIEISESINWAKKQVKGKEAADALFSFANMMPRIEVEKIMEFSVKLLQEHPAQAFTPITVTSPEGLEIAKYPAFNPRNNDNKARIEAEMVKHFRIEVGFRSCMVWSALDILQREHRLAEGDFHYIVKYSPIIPEANNISVAKALFAGYNNDSITTINILAPQVENFVRQHMKLQEITTIGTKNGIQFENGLSILMENPGVIEIFGANLAFELKALFCHPCGPNLRNRVAHGLMKDDESQSLESLYAWWLIFSIVFRAFYCFHQQANKDKEQE